jgi:AraC-like DNA-binding protein
MDSPLRGMGLADLVVPRTASKVQTGLWQKQVNKSVSLHFSFDFEAPSAFAGTITQRSLDELGMFSVTCQRHTVYREAGDLELDDDAYFLLTLQVSGHKRLLQGGNSTTIRPGQFALYDSERPLVLEVPDDYRSVNVKFRKKALGAHDTALFSQMVAQPFSADRGIAPVVWSTILSLYSLDATAGSGAVLIAGNVIEMAAAMLRTQAGTDAGDSDMRDFRLRAVQAYVNDHLHEPELRVDAIAAANFLSVRHLHNLFRHTGYTVAGWIRHQRVETAKRALADPGTRTVPAATIGLRCGFGTASHFGHVFKTATGLTPAEFRDQSQSRDAGR